MKLTLKSKNPVVVLLWDINKSLGPNLYNLEPVANRTLKRWFEGLFDPPPTSVREVALKLWDEMEKDDLGGKKKAIYKRLRKEGLDTTGDLDKVKFGNWFYDLAEQFNPNCKRPTNPAAKTKQRRWPPENNSTAILREESERPYDPGNPIHARVNSLFEQAHFTVSGCFVQVDSETRVDLEPLYAYVRSLQESAQVPNLFTPGRTIQLDALYVELTAAEDQRSDEPQSRSAGEKATWADHPSSDIFGAWRESTQRLRIPLEAMISRTEIQPAVLFGDPGCGKTTLTEYALHELGRALVEQKSPLAGSALPFRISLREFAVKGLPDKYEIIPYLLREKLHVPANVFEDWRMLLGYFFHNEKPFRLILLVDGVDEVTFDTNLFPIIRVKLEDITAIARVLLTSRRAGFEAPVRNYTSFEVVELLESSIHGLIRNWFNHVNPNPPAFIESFSRWIFGDRKRQQMAGNPCLLSLLCYLNKDLPPGGFILAKNRAELYGRAVEKLTSDYDRLGVAPIRASLDNLASFALGRYLNLDAGEAPHVLFTGEEVREFFRRAVSSGQVWIQSAPTEALDLHLDHVWLKTRLVSQWNLGDWYHFIHQSFQEYFAALCLAAMPREEVSKLIGQYRFNPHWLEVWRFYAGLNQAQGSDGRIRFEELAVAYVRPRDFYDQTLFWLAPLCAEFGLCDTRQLLGFDLREELYAVVLSGGKRMHPYLRVLVDVDPEYFLDVAKRVLNPYLEYYRQPGRTEGELDLPDVHEVEIAVEILENIYHPSALSYQRTLIEAEVHWPPLAWTDPPLGPISRSGRNYALGADLAQWLAEAPGMVQRQRLANYLACTGGPGAGEAIFQAAITNKQYVGRKRIHAKGTRKDIDFQVFCLSVLVELQHPLTIELAKQLWGNQEFRKKHLDQACEHLRRFRSPSVVELLEVFLAEAANDLNPRVIEPILKALKEWPQRCIPETLERILASPKADPELRALGWQVLVRSGGQSGRDRLRKHLAEMMNAEKWTRRAIREIGALAGFIGSEKLNASVELDLLLQRAQHERRRTLANILWACLTELNGTDARLPSQRVWFRDSCLPALRIALSGKGSERDTSIPNWLTAFEGCPSEIVRELGDMVRLDLHKIPKETQVWVLQFFTGCPDKAPNLLLEKAFASQDSHLRGLAREIIAAVDPGRLVVIREEDKEAGNALRAESLLHGTLFFTDGFYSPKLIGFQRYSGNG